MVKNLPANAGATGDARDWVQSPKSGGSRGVRSGTPLQYSFLEKSVGRGAWQATVRGHSQT